MPRYVVTTRPEGEFSSCIVLGIHEATNPEGAVMRVCENALDDDFVEMDDGVSAKGMYELTKKIYSEEDPSISDGFHVFEVGKEFVEEGLQLEQ